MNLKNHARNSEKEFKFMLINTSFLSFISLYIASYSSMLRTNEEIDKECDIEEKKENFNYKFS